jgi:predicted phosphodiesterase
MTVSALQEANRVGLIGDVHGDLSALLAISQSMRSRGVDVLLVLGDLGLVWGGSENWSNRLSRLSKRLRSRDQVLYWVDGNHDDHRRLSTFPVDSDGLRRLRDNIIHLPRGYRTVLATEKTLLALGGANSIDYESRVSGLTWWPEEAITEADLEAVGREHADIMVGHDAPLDLPSLDIVLAANVTQWSRKGLEYAASGRKQFHDAFLRTSPNLYLGGHYHQPVDESVEYSFGRQRFHARVVLLDQVQDASRASCAILSVGSMDLEFFDRAGKLISSVAFTGGAGREMLS